MQSIRNTYPEPRRIRIVNQFHIFSLLKSIQKERRFDGVIPLYSHNNSFVFRGVFKRDFDNAFYLSYMQILKHIQYECLLNRHVDSWNTYRIRYNGHFNI